MVKIKKTADNAKVDGEIKIPMKHCELPQNGICGNETKNALWFWRTLCLIFSVGIVTLVILTQRGVQNTYYDH